MSNIPERNKGYKEGLQNFINYISKDYNTRELSIVEIGVWTGAGSEIFAKSFKEVHCIDMWKPTKTDSLTIRFNVKEAEKIFDARKDKYENIFKCKGSWEYYIKLFKNTNRMFDVVYVDMDKIYENNLLCLTSFFPITKLYMGGHDYEKRFPGVVKAVNRMFGKPQQVFKDKSWIYKLNKGEKNGRN